jgi:uncharacterized protein YkwD
LIEGASLGRMKMRIAAVGLVLGLSAPAVASDYASQISAYRRAHGLSAVRADSKLSAVALRQAQAMAFNLLMPGAKKVGVASVANVASPYRMFWAMVITD